MTKLARDNMMRYVMKTAHSISKEVGVGIDQGLKVAWSMIRIGSPIRYTKVVGVSYGNSQQLLKTLVDENIRFFVRLERERFNIHDSNAIAVYVVVRFSSKLKIGYINSTRSSSLAYEMDAGRKVVVLSAEVTGNDDVKQYLGMNLKFIVI